MSRNEYLKRQLERLAWLDKTESERNRFEEALKEVAVVLINLQNKIEEDGATIKQLKFMLMQAMDVTEEEMNNFINEFGLPEGDV